MEFGNIRTWIYLSQIGVAGSVFVLVFAIGFCYKPVGLVLRTYEEISSSLRKSKNGLLDYGRLKCFLESNGADFHFGSWVNPINYTGIRIVAGAIGMLGGNHYGIPVGILAAVALYQLPDLMLVWLNKKDNEQMIPELKMIYGALVMQIKAGVHILDALSECYTSVTDKRLRRALYVLSGNIVMNADAAEALEELGNRFDNRYIDALCITVLQALESGQSVDVLTDISEQMKDLEAAAMSRKKSSLDRSITFYQLGILAAVLLIVLYASVTHLLSLALNF